MNFLVKYVYMVNLFGVCFVTGTIVDKEALSRIAQSHPTSDPIPPQEDVWSSSSDRSKSCPDDYSVRVQTCIMESQVAPQAGGGLSLITDKNKLDELCSRGILHKTIDCLTKLEARCSGNTTRRRELAMLFNLEDWRQGMDLLCEDLSLFRKHFTCLSQHSTRISSCILIRTQSFRRAIQNAGKVTHKALHDITCNFAENIVSCLERPLSRKCPEAVVDTMVTALHRFLPPACAPLPALRSGLETVIVEGGGQFNRMP